MKRAGARYALIAAVVFSGAPATKAVPVVNEVLANEPGGQTTLEWIELYNPDDTAVALDSWTLDIDSASTVALSSGVLIDSGGFFIVCRRLYAGGSSVGFESIWGDSSGAWGDCECESNIVTPLEASFSLANGAGYVALIDPLGTEQSRLSWTESGADGVSWERVEPGADSIAPCLDSRGGTPGALNSVTPVPHDLALQLIAVRAVDGEARIDLEITNPGRDRTGPTQLTVGSCDDSACTITVPLDSLTVTALDPGEQCGTTQSYTFGPTYTTLELALGDDDRTANNRLVLVVPGRNYPPIILSEFLANPDNELETEWIECYNRDDTSINLNGWLVGDSRTTASVTATPSTDMAPYSYLILAQDTFAFRDSYPDCDALLLQPSPWPTLNNTGDSVRLIGPYNIEADRFAYTNAFDYNRTWCRAPSGYRWGCSRADGGTPGAPNELILPLQNSVSVNCVPRIFAPSLGETVTIELSTSELPVTIRLFDRQGRVVRSFGEVTGAVAWQGRSDAGRALPIGMYIVVVEDESGASARQTVVIAR